ncbi:MAG: leucine-rich repeat domain-containing protein [Clostridia bacterium]|nr:leucine-rich repeat domain-containing protein [Clostridia bacterium]
MKDYSDIEKRIEKNISGLQSAVRSPSAMKRSAGFEKKEKEQNAFFAFMNRPGIQVTATVLISVVLFGGMYLGILKLNSIQPKDPGDTASVSETDDTVSTAETDEQAAGKRMKIKAETSVYGIKTNNIDLNTDSRQIELTVSFENVTDLASASLKISWYCGTPGSGLMTLLDAEYLTKGLTNMPDTPWSEVESPYTFNWLALGPEDALKTGADFIRLTFRLADDVGPWEVVFGIEPDGENIFDSDSKNVPYVLENETVRFQLLHYTVGSTETETKTPYTDTGTAPPETETTAQTTESEEDWYATSAPETDDPYVYTTNEFTTAEETAPPGEYPMVYPAYLTVSDGNEEIYPPAYEGSADGAEDVPVLQYDGSEIKLSYLDITSVQGVTGVDIGIKADGVSGNYYENYINDYLKTKHTGIYRFVISFEIKKNGKSERWEYPFVVEVWTKEEVTTQPETTGPDETTEPDETAEPPADDIINYLHFIIIDPTEDESNLTVSYYGTEKFAQLTGIDECSFDDVIIPSEYNGYPVKSVTGWYDDDLFMNINGLAYVEFPDTVVRIEQTLRMFRGNKTLVEVRLPKNLKEIPQELFYGCENLKTVIMPETLETVGINAFYGCKSLRIDTVPPTVKTIGGNAFSGCTKITRFTVPDGVMQLGGGAFGYCSNLKEITLPDSLLSIGDECFYSTSIKSIVIPRNKDYPELPTLGRSLFAGCTVLEHVELPEGSNEITWQMFCNCTRLKQLDIPETVTSIDTRAFAECGIETVRIGKNVSSIATGTFIQFNGNIEIDPENPYYRIENGEIVRISED